MSEPHIEIEAVCEMHRGSGRLVVRRESDRIVLDARADHSVPVPVPPLCAQCPVDQHVHLLAPAQAQAAEIHGHVRAGCGRRIPAVGLTIDGPAAGLCVSCMTVGTAP